MYSSLICHHCILNINHVEVIFAQYTYSKRRIGSSKLGLAFMAAAAIPAWTGLMKVDCQFLGVAVDKHAVNSIHWMLWSELLWELT